MALAASVRFDFVDVKGKTSSTKIRIPDSFTIASVVEFAQAAGQILLDGSQGAITGISVTFSIPISGLGLKTIASSLSKVARKMYLQFSTAANGFFGKTLFPTLDELKVVSGSDDVDQGDEDVSALISALEDDIVVTGGSMVFTNGRGYNLVALQTAKEQFLGRTAA